MINKALIKINGRLIARSFLVLMLFIAIFNAIIANEKPIAGKSNGHWTYPALKDFIHDMIGKSDHGSIVTPIYSKAYYAPIRYSANSISDISQNQLNPKKGSVSDPPHYLGTDKLGRDLAAGIVRGAYNALRIGLLSTLIACILGILIGLLIGYFGDEKIKINYLQAIVLPFVFSITVFYSLYSFCQDPMYNNFAWIAWFGGVLTLMFLANKSKLKKHLNLPLDTLVMRVVEIRKSIPFLIFLLALLSVFTKPQVTNVVLILSLLSWPVFTRHTRAEVMSLKHEDFVKSALAAGVSWPKIVFRHILPNLMPTLVIVFVFQLSSNILIESTLSYLGIGLPTDEISWGSLLNEGRKTYAAWWLTLFPGLVLFLVIFSLNIMSDKYSSGKTA